MSETHAAIYALGFARTTGGPGERKMLEMMLGKLAETHLSPQRIALTYRMFIDTVLSMCGMRAALLCLPAELAQKDEAAWMGVYAVLPQQDYPAVRRYARAMSEVSNEDIYAATIQVVLDRIETETSPTTA